MLVADPKDLWQVAQTNDPERLKQLLASGVDVDATTEHGMTPLMFAASRGRIEMVRMLLAHGADPNAMRGDKFTPLLLAAFFGHSEVVRILVEHGAEIKTGPAGTSAHTWATTRGFNEIARYLQMAGEHSRPVYNSDAANQKQKPSLVKRNDELESDTTADDRFVTDVLPEPLPRSTSVETGNEYHDYRSVKTLKDPPEIWDLVHEAPRTFNPLGNLLARIASLSRGAELAVLLVLILMVGGLVAGLTYIRPKTGNNDLPSRGRDDTSRTNGNDVNTHNQIPKDGQTQSADLRALTDKTDVSLGSESVTTGKVDSSNADVQSPPNSVLAVQPTASAPSKPRRRSQVRPAPSRNNSPTDPNETNKPVLTTKRSEDVPQQMAEKNQRSTALSPQLIAPAKTSSSKAKVIQWP